MLSRSLNILLIGSGAREHSLAWALKKSSLCRTLYIAPGNAGTEEVGLNVHLNASDHDQIIDFLTEKEVDLLIIGPEQPLVEGLRDSIESRPALAALTIIGPGQLGAQLEGSKAWSKAFMQRHKIPTASYHVIRDYSTGLEVLQQTPGPYVLKADGLAAGKGVLIIPDRRAAEISLQEMLDGQFGEAGSTVVIESFLDGIEFSVFVLTDGEHYVLLPEAKDYKRAEDGDRGPNTGGMGSVSPVPFYTESLRKKVIDQVIEPTIQGLKAESIPYVGFIFFGLILVEGEPFVIEYNARMGDPETQVVMSRLQEDLVELFWAVGQGLNENRVAQCSDDFYVNVVLASGGYPGSYQKNKRIELPQTSEDEHIFHAGTRSENGEYLSSGGRVLSAVARASHLGDAMAQANKLADQIIFEKKYHRTDIGRDLM